MFVTVTLITLTTFETGSRFTRCAHFATNTGCGKGFDRSEGATKT